MTFFADLHTTNTPLRLGILEDDAVWPPRDVLAAQAHIIVETIEPAAAISDSTPWDVALLPPWIAFQIEGVRIVPGIGVVNSTDNLEIGTIPQEDPEKLLLSALDQDRQDSDLLNAWRSLTELPFVSRVWTCRRRAPYPAIRGALSAAHQAAMAVNSASEGASHRIASVESDSLRFLIALLKQHNRLPEQAELTFC